MIRKIMAAFVVLIFAVFVSCNDTETVTPEKKDGSQVAPPPRTFPVNGKLLKCLSTQTAKVYVKINSGSWTLINSVTSTVCDSIGSFSANTGDSLRVKVLDQATGYDVEFRAKTALSCPTTSWPTYCGATAFVLGANDPALSVTVSVNSSTPPCGNLIICN